MSWTGEHSVFRYWMDTTCNHLDFMISLVRTCSREHKMSGSESNPKADTRHDAFISYSRRDREFARALGDTLENYRPPKDLGVGQRHLDIFRDEEDFTGVEYHTAVSRHLGESGRLILVHCNSDI